MSLRPKQTSTLRKQILDVADGLIRQAGGTDFSMRTLASVAGVSPATPYNIFGSKEGLLYALLARAINDLITKALVQTADDPIDQVVQAAEGAVDVILSDPAVMRPLYQVLLGVPDLVSRPRIMKTSLRFWRSTLNTAVDKGILVNDADCNILAYSLMAHFIGFLYLWVHDDISDEEFRARVIYGFVHQLWPLASGKYLKHLKARMARAKTDLERQRAR